jgi:hypothetical protein
LIGVKIDRLPSPEKKVIRVVTDAGKDAPSVVEKEKKMFKAPGQASHEVPFFLVFFNWK